MPFTRQKKKFGNKKWTKDEDKFLIENHDYTILELEQIMHRSAASLYKRLAYLGINLRNKHVVLIKNNIEYIICIKCKTEKTLDKFYKNTSYDSGYMTTCKACCPKRKYSPYVDKRAKYKNKLLAFDNYGRECNCCGETNLEFLTIDHSNMDGAQHRKEVGGGSRFYQWLKNNNYPQNLGLRVLCFNCNASIGFQGYCPHEATNALFYIEEVD